MRQSSKHNAASKSLETVASFSREQQLRKDHQSTGVFLTLHYLFIQSVGVKLTPLLDEYNNHHHHIVSHLRFSGKYFWCTVLQTTGSQSFQFYDWCNLFISVCDLELLRDRPRRDVKSLISATWAHVLWGTTRQTMCCVRKDYYLRRMQPLWLLDVKGLICQTFMTPSGVFLLNEWKYRELNNRWAFVCMEILPSQCLISVTFKAGFPHSTHYVFTTNELLLPSRVAGWKTWVPGLCLYNKRKKTSWKYHF